MLGKLAESLKKSVEDVKSKLEEGGDVDRHDEKLLLKSKTVKGISKNLSMKNSLELKFDSHSMKRISEPGADIDILRKQSLFESSKMKDEMSGIVMKKKKQMRFNKTFDQQY